MNFKCVECGGTQVEEIMGGVTQSSLVNGVECVGQQLVMDYGDTSTSGGDSLYYQCAECGNEVSIEELTDLAK